MTVGITTGMKLTPARLNNIVFARKIADETVNNSATLQNDDALFVAVAANTVYEIGGVIAYNSNATADIKLGWTAPGGLTAMLSMQGYDAAGTVFMADARAITDVVAFGGVGAFYTVVIEGIIIVGGTAGTLRLQWAQNTANASNTIVGAGSHLRLLRVT